MKILMLTNTYLPHVGGVANSVSSFKAALEERDHDVLVVAPTFEGAESEPREVVRLSAVQNFSGSDFSVRVPVPGELSAALDDFAPELVHSHHPFLLGDTALRVATSRELPLVFTHHTMYERYTHYVPGDSAAMKRFAIRMATEYANLCDHVIAPSESVAEVLRDRGVEVPLSVVPTGIRREDFADGDGSRARRRHGLDPDDPVVGHVGRLAPEKNLEYLARAVGAFLRDHDNARFLLVGDGPSREPLRKILGDRGVADRLHDVGKLQGQELVDAYHAMDVFAFASHTETQGMVLAEALISGVPLVALDAPGAREVVEDGANGRLLDDADEEAFAGALEEVAAWQRRDPGALAERCRQSAEPFTLASCTRALLEVYRRGLAERPMQRRDESPWTRALRLLEAEWQLWSGRAEAVARSLRDDEPPEEGDPARGDEPGGPGDRGSSGDPDDTDDPSRRAA